MRVKCKLIGSGVDVDPWRVPYPTYNMLECDTLLMTAIVDVPDETLPDGYKDDPGLTKTIIKGSTVVTDVSTSLRTKLNAHFDNEYKERAGTFRPTPSA